MLAVHWQGNAFQQPLVVMHPVGDDDLEFRAGACDLHIAGANIGLGGESVGDDAAIRHARDQLLHRRMVYTHRGEAIERNVRNESRNASCNLSKSP